MSFTPFIEAEYENGYVHSDRFHDVSPFVHGKNVFHDIYEGHPEQFHGKLIRFSLVTPEKTYSIDWRNVPEGSKPIRFKHMRMVTNAGGGIVEEASIDSIDFGLKWTDEDGKHEEVKRIHG